MIPAICLPTSLPKGLFLFSLTAFFPFEAAAQREGDLQSQGSAPVPLVLHRAIALGRGTGDSKQAPGLCQRTDGRQTFGAARSSPCDLPAEAQSSCGEHGQTSSLTGCAADLFSHAFGLKNNNNKANKHPMPSLQNTALCCTPGSPCPRTSAQLLPQIKPFVPPSRPWEQLCVSPARPSSSPFPKISSCLWMRATSRCWADLLTAKHPHLFCCCSAKSGSRPCVVAALSTELRHKAGSPQLSADPQASRGLVAAQPAETASAAL